MTNNHRRARELFVAACDLTFDEQQLLLDQECSDDPVLRKEVELLLLNDQGESEFQDHTHSIASSESETATIADNELPIRIGRYQIKRRLGHGGMGEVFLATQENPRRDVAIKVIRFGGVSKETLKRFELETRVLGQLNHPGVAQILEAGTADIEYPSGLFRQPYFAMEFVNGKTILEHAKENDLSIRDRLRLIIDVCNAVHSAHQQGIIHRDLKPGNILIDESGNVKVLDFGIARVMDVDSHEMQTQTGNMIGTPAYMSPEQMAADSSQVDTRSDVYSIGVIAYELLCGRKPHMIDKLPLDEAIRQKHQTVNRMSTSDSRLRGDVETIIQKTMASEKNRRYASVSELSADIARYLDHLPIEARPASLGYQFRKFAKRNKVAVASAAIVFAVLLASTLLISKFYLDQSVALQKTQRQILIAQEINQFLNSDLLGQANPSNSGKRDPSVRELLDLAADKVTGRFDELPEVEAELRQTLGQTYFGLGVYAEAEKQFKKSIELFASIDEVEPARLIHARDRYARSLVHQWKLKECERWCLANLQDAKDWLGNDHFRTAECHANLGILLKRQGKFKEAEEQYRRTISILKDSNDFAELKLCNAQRNNLSLVLNDQNRRDEAEEIMRKVVQNWRDMGSPPVETAFGLHSLAAQLWEQYKRKDLSQEVRNEKIAESEKLFDEALKIRIQLYGENHPETAYTLYGIGLVHKSKREYETALELFEKVLDIRRSIYKSDNNLPVLDTINGIGTTLNSLERYEEAADEFELAFVTALDAFGPNHYRTKGLYFSNLLYTLRVFLKDDARIRQLRDEFFDRLADSAKVKLFEALSLTLNANEKFEEAVEIQLELNEFLEKTDASAGRMAWAYNLLSQYYTSLNDIDKADAAKARAERYQAQKAEVKK